ncbi:MAG: hypothetical protein PVH98_05265, partial [Gammaproteobacteria bacterium]
PGTDNACHRSSPAGSSALRTKAPVIKPSCLLQTMQRVFSKCRRLPQTQVNVFIEIMNLVMNYLGISIAVWYQRAIANTFLFNTMKMIQRFCNQVDNKVDVSN